MRTDALLKDPVFQLNLLVWMAKEQPPKDYLVRPLFYELGFEIIYIEQPFPLPEEVVRTITASALDISNTPEPEMILGRKTDNRALYFEAKANSFGTASPTCKQARAHLLANGPAFGEVLTPLTTSLLCYVVPELARGPMSTCLCELATALKAKGLKPGSHSCHGLSFDRASIVYSWDTAFKTHAGAAYDALPIVDEVRGDTDPSPLVLVFSDEDCSNLEIRDFYRRVVLDQVRASLLCDLHSHGIGTQYDVTAEKLLLKTTDGILKYLGRERQKRLHRLVRENILKKIHEYWKDKQVGVRLSQDALSITWGVIGEKEAFLDWLEDRRTRFDTEKPVTEKPTDGPSLFDQLDEGFKGN